MGCWAGDKHELDEACPRGASSLEGEAAPGANEHGQRQ